ncbi:X8 domain [Dillenia turbinata]|uniref:glucan endo-1,3-beta-D-glucosidase n=1 Tax=Dillenia turbinata TaxID=194707 RepID=A0AAN8VUU5_9MAGN
MLCFLVNQSMAALMFTHFILLVLTLISLTDGGSIGINYGRVADNLQTPKQVADLLKSQGITKVKIYDTNSDVLTALSNSGISVVVALPNEQLSAAASSQSYTDTWVQSNISPFYPSTQIETITVGNEVFVDPANTTSFLVPAMKNVHSSLVKYNLDSSIKVSSPIALSALQTSYPSSSGSFKSDLAGPVMVPMLQLLRQTGSYLMVNAYPFFAYEANSQQISLDYALFKPNSGVVDPNNGLRYTSLLEAQLDAVYAAMAALQFNDVPIIVSETGWPSQGDENEIGAGSANAAAYNGNLVKRVLTGGGTPLRPQQDLYVYLFALFNEDLKTGPTSERNYGLFYPNEQKVYDIPLTVAALNGSASSSGSGNMNNGSKVVVQGQRWCVANENVAAEKLQSALDYACGEGKADCRPIQEGATCYDPNSLVAHASYAFNSYYQMNARAAGTCDFGGAAYVVTQPPRKFTTAHVFALVEVICDFSVLVWSRECIRDFDKKVIWDFVLFA